MIARRVINFPYKPDATASLAKHRGTCILVDDLSSLDK